MYFFAAIAFSRRTAKDRARDQAAGKKQSTLAALGWGASRWVGTAALIFIGGTWFSSGFYGQ